MTLYRRRELVDAFQWDGREKIDNTPEWFRNAIRNKEVWFGYKKFYVGEEAQFVIFIGLVDDLYRTVRVNDYIMYDSGQIYGFPPNIFNEMYIQVE